MKKTKNYSKDTFCSCGKEIKFNQDCFVVPIPKIDTLFTALESGVITTQKYICTDCGLGFNREPKSKFATIDLFADVQ